jgi:hypothetical protein
LRISATFITVKEVYSISDDLTEPPDAEPITTKGRLRLPLVSIPQNPVAV